MLADEAQRPSGPASPDDGEESKDTGLVARAKEAMKTKKFFAFSSAMEFLTTLPLLATGVTSEIVMISLVYEVATMLLIGFTPWDEKAGVPKRGTCVASWVSFIVCAEVLLDGLVAGLSCGNAGYEGGVGPAFAALFKTVFWLLAVPKGIKAERAASDRCACCGEKSKSMSNPCVLIARIYFYMPLIVVFPLAWYAGANGGSLD